MRLRLSLILGLTVLSAGFARWYSDPAATFPHRRHARLFPTSCAGCHAGIATESKVDRFPSPQSCAQCHNGRDQKPVSWTGHVSRPTNLVFSHADHPRDAGGDIKVDCQSCHRDQSGDENPMAVSRAVPSTCVSCHAHRAASHLADDSRCSTCHVPLTKAVGLSDSVVAALPKPPSHTRQDFISTHGAKLAATSSCATCHSRESCARCHPNGDRVAGVARLASDSRVAALVKLLAPVYPTPANHRAESWTLGHGSEAKRDAQSCANCHTQSSCRSCHTGSTGSDVIATLAVAEQGRASGVRLTRTAVHRTNFARTHGPTAAGARQTCAGCHVQKFCADCHSGRSARVPIHASNFVTTHGPSAGSGRMTCTECHAQKFCTDCHDGSSRRRFHASNYMTRHAADAYGGEKSCNSCHNAETFCRSCHIGNGIAGRGTRVAAHNGQPLWLLQHAQAARQGLEGCTTCHQQRDCLRCHSDLGRRVNPHGSDFDANRYATRNRVMCFTCHLTDPLKQP